MSFFGARERETGVLLGEGIALGDRQGGIIPIHLPNAFRVGHVFIAGSTRSGKTRLAENMVEADIRAGRSVIFIDPKGDVELLTKVIQTTMVTRRMDDLMLVSPIYPEYSAILNPCSHWFMPEELVSHCVAGIKEGNDPYYRNVSKDITMLIIMAEKLIAESKGRRLEVTLEDIKRKTSRSELERLKNTLSSIMTPEAAAYAEDLQKVLENPPEYYSKVSSSLRVALNDLTMGNIGQIIGKADENRFMTRLEEGKRVIMVVQLGSMLTSEAGYTLGKTLLSMIKSFVGRAFASKKQKINPPLAIYIDEAQSCVHPGFEDLLSKAGGANVYVTLLTQSINMLTSAVGEDYAKAILDNTNTKIFLRVPDIESAQYIAPHFGMNKVLSPIFSRDNLTTREMEEEMVKPHEILVQKPREFYMFTYATDFTKGMFRGRTANISETFFPLIMPDSTMGPTEDSKLAEERTRIFDESRSRGEKYVKYLLGHYHDEVKSVVSDYSVAAIGYFFNEEDNEIGDMLTFGSTENINTWLYIHPEASGFKKCLALPPPDHDLDISISEKKKLAD